MQTVGDKTRIDDVRQAHERARVLMRETAVAENVGDRRAVTAEDYLRLLGVSATDRNIFFTKICTAYHNEMLAAWTAIYAPLPVKKHAPRSWITRAWVSATLGFAVYGAVHLLNTIAKAVL